MRVETSSLTQQLVFWVHEQDAKQILKTFWKKNPCENSVEFPSVTSLTFGIETRQLLKSHFCCAESTR